ncbi:unnamed protein product [Microthlaspi erraticum]|uniref:Uncharacterized protein n=1 Tax=Microthlaspi erraticum TaxID=1685480 RepID=A0A6D2HVZ7_9BRAS|nr:unnamed protein product [Microthlaspi erraticum]
MGPSSSSYTLQVSFLNVESQRYISDSLPLPVPKLVHLMFLPWIETVSLMFVLIVMENLLIHVWVSMGPSSSSYTLQVSFLNVESQRYISDSLPLPVPKFGPFDVPPLD